MAFPRRSKLTNKIAAQPTNHPIGIPGTDHILERQGQNETKCVLEDIYPFCAVFFVQIWIIFLCNWLICCFFCFFVFLISGKERWRSFFGVGVGERGRKRERGREIAKRNRKRQTKGESKHVWNAPLHCAVRNACQPWIRLLHASRQWLTVGPAV